MTTSRGYCRSNDRASTRGQENYTMDELEQAVEGFLLEHPVRVKAILVFLSNSEITQPVYNLACTKVRLGLKFGSRTVRVEFETDPNGSFFGANYSAKLAESIFKNFRLRQPFRSMINSKIGWYSGAYEHVVNGLVRGGGVEGFVLMGGQIDLMRARNDVFKMRKARKIQASLNCVDSAMRYAVKDGASVAQLQKLVRMIAAEKSIEKIHNT